MDPFIRIKNLSKAYETKHGTVQALVDVTFDIHAGEIFSLLGANGAGKTTLSSILATLHPPTGGTVCVNGKSIYDDIYTFRRMLGFCPQRQNLDMFLSVQENLEFAGRYFLLDKDTIQKRVAHLLGQLELERYAHFSIHALSGGTKQRVLIARALMHEPRFVILDEPTVGLDPDIRRKLWELIKHLKSMGITVLLTTHYLDEADYLSDRICVLHKGRIVLIESVHSLKSTRGKEKLEDIFLDIMKEQEE
ncbi:MAG TPA: ABC transporter ATP-binding protein [Candidatus Bathyarchaeia archaeon]|nr:ABC transporter ATP-binding protein [Candidatus Bathyarchaeia archaeon]